MEKRVGVNHGFWRGRRVLVTGHTGFKGGWLTLWLTQMGAEVHGVSLPPPTTPSFHDVCGIESRVASIAIGDIADPDFVAAALQRSRPEVVMHLAAQPLVRLSYDAPAETFRVNVMGTLNVLEAARHARGVRAVVNVTTDKCYENREWVWPYREDEPVGGRDPYSASKACSELVSAAYRDSFLAAAGIQVATARAGNVIGGGDWAQDRLLPDILRAVDGGQPVSIRSPKAVRPWQHVLDPLSGYLTLAERLVTDGPSFASAWNFGPNEDGRPVEWIVDRLCAELSGAAWSTEASPARHEAQTLRLDSSKARAGLGWRPRWTLEIALDRTLAWHRAWRSNLDMAQVSIEQLAEYEAAPDS
jgi:CDP-glucose 4,6-dehydratase